MIRYTGNPYVDAGVAVLELRLQKPCNEMTLEDLASQAEEIKKEYTKPLWKSYLMVHLPNCAWTQKDISSEKNQAYLGKVLESYKAEYPELNRKCAFCGRPSKIFADRRYVPLLTGETVISSGAAGIPGLPVCGWCVFAVHFYPFATLKVEGRPLFWWTPDPAWTRRLTRAFSEKLNSTLAMSSDELAKLPWPNTQLIQSAREVIAKLDDEKLSPAPPLLDITGVHATNYGTDPDFEELHIPRGLLEFWREAGSFPAYHEIERSAWETQVVRRKGNKKKKRSPKTAKEGAEARVEISPLMRRNYFYEALGDAFRESDYQEKAKGVALRFFLRRKGKDVAPQITRVTELFLEKVAEMEKERLVAIREIADAIVQSRDAKWMIGRLMRSGRSLYDFVPTIRSIQYKLCGEKKSITWEKVLLALNLADANDATPRDTWLVSELILIRIFEQLSISQPALLADVEIPEETNSVTQSSEGVN